MDRESIIFYRSFFDAIRALGTKDRLSAYDMLMHYAFSGEKLEGTKQAELIFTLSKPQIDANDKKRLSGKQGGRPAKKEGEK